MNKKICLLMGVILVCTSLTGCSASDTPQKEQEVIQIPRDDQEPVQSPQNDQEPVQSPQDDQEPVQSPQNDQEPVQSPQDDQEPVQSPQGDQGSVQTSQNDQEPGQSPQDNQQPSQDQTEEAEYAGDFLYEAFLKNEISVSSPYVEGMDLSVMDDTKYDSEFEEAQKKYAYVDVNGDDNPELIFKISSYPSELMYILGVCDNELICFDVFETHTNSIGFGVYDYGFVWQAQRYDGFEMVFYTYTADGQPMEARRFTEENDADIAAYEGKEPEWFDWQTSIF